MRNFIQPGKVLTMTAPSGGVTSGSFVKIGAVFGVAATTAAESEEFEMAVGEVYDLPKVAAQAWSVGDVIYADGTGIMTTVETGNTKVGVAVEAAENPSGTGRVRLNDNF